MSTVDIIEAGRTYKEQLFVYKVGVWNRAVNGIGPSPVADYRGLPRDTEFVWELIKRAGLAEEETDSVDDIRSGFIGVR